jgi:hypothetical protein
VHPTQTLGQFLVRGVHQHDDQIDVADAGIELAPRQGPEEVQTHQGWPDHGQDRLPDGIQFGGRSRIQW